MKLKNINDDGLFTWWKIIDRSSELIFFYENKNRDYKSQVGHELTDVEKYNLVKDIEVLEIFDIDIDSNWENNLITVRLNCDKDFI